MMRRALRSLAIVLGLLLGPMAVAPVAARTAATAIPSASYTTPQAVTWGEPNHTAKTITVSVRLQIYAPCPHCGARINEFLEGQMESLAKEMSKRIREVWNQHYHYYCYELIFEVDITVGSDSSHVDGDRVGVRIDNSPVAIRDNVHGLSDKDKWNSNDPADRVEPINDPDHPSTWSQRHTRDRDYAYAHEFGHILGLHDGYEDKKDPSTGRLRSVTYPGAPDDLMGAAARYYPKVAQATINRLVERSPVDRSKLKCDYTVVGRYREENSSFVCGGAVSPLMEDRVTLSLTWTERGYEITEIKNVPTTHAPPRMPVSGTGVSVRMAPGFDSDPDILLAKDGTVSVEDDTGIFIVRLTGDIHIGSCTFSGKGGSRTLDPGGTEATEVSFEFDRHKFSGGTQTVPPRPYDFWTWVVTEK